jgi:hypothetical protein
MAGGNLTNYKASAPVRTADLDTAKLHWNSVISTELAKFMCLDIKNFYLMAALDVSRLERYCTNILLVRLTKVRR